jgi:hypothetical protein
MVDTFLNISKKIERFNVNKWSNYVEDNGIYNDIFKNINVNNITNILEIGTQRGGSTQIISTMFPNAKVITVDINPLNTELGDNITVIKNNATNVEFLSTLNTFDIIWDDGSHDPNDQIKSFEYLFKNKLKENGLYIIEDLEHSYQSWWKKDNNQINFFNYISKLVNSINSKTSHTKATNKGPLKHNPDYYTENLFNISLYPQIVCFTKRKNIEPKCLTF